VRRGPSEFQVSLHAEVIPRSRRAVKKRCPNLRLNDCTKIVTASENEKVFVADASDVGSVQRFVAPSAKRDQISLNIVTDCAAPSQMVNIKILETATYLTAPVVTRQDFFA
jgi:hypothetical protein